MVSTEKKIGRFAGRAAIGVLAAMVLAFLHWFGLIAFGPAEVIEAYVLSPLLVHMELAPGGQSSQFSNSIELTAQFFRWLVGGGAWMALSLAVGQWAVKRIRIMEAGSVAAYNQRVSDAQELRSRLVPVGNLVGIQISVGGLFSNSQSIVETDQGFYRVAGLVGDRLKGEPVYRRQHDLFIGEEGRRRRLTILD